MQYVWGQGKTKIALEKKLDQEPIINELRTRHWRSLSSEWVCLIVARSEQNIDSIIYQSGFVVDPINNCNSHSGKLVNLQHWARGVIS